jgi:hypothetical protein
VAVSTDTDVDDGDDTGGRDQGEDHGVEDDVDWTVEQLFKKYNAGGTGVLKREELAQAVKALAGTRSSLGARS